MKLIQKTGSKPESSNSTKTKQFGLFECPVCHEHVERSLNHGRRNKSCGKHECRKATFNNPDNIGNPGKSIHINNNLVKSRNSLRYFAGFRAWYNRLNDKLINQSIDTIEKAADMLYVEYEITKMQYPNQRIELSLKDLTKPITKENAYFTISAKSKGTDANSYYLNKLNKSTGLSVKSILKIIEHSGLDITKDYNALYEKAIIEKHSHSKQTEYLYLIKAGPYVKIGVAENPNKRLKEISTGCPFKPEIVATKALGKLCYLVERYLHIQYADKCTNGEWFELDEADIKAIIDTPEDELVSNAANIINTNKEAYVESTRVYNDESKLSKLRIEAEERYLQTCANYEESKRKAREANKKPKIETFHEWDERFANDRTNQIKSTTTHGMSHTDLYKTWQNMKKVYAVCDEWQIFEPFQKAVEQEYAQYTEEQAARVYPLIVGVPIGPTNYKIESKYQHEIKSGVAKAVEKLGKTNEVLAEYASVTEAAKAVDGIASKISAVCKGTRKTHAGFNWRYKE